MTNSHCSLHIVPQRFVNNNKYSLNETQNSYVRLPFTTQDRAWALYSSHSGDYCLSAWAIVRQIVNLDMMFGAGYCEKIDRPERELLAGTAV